MSRNGPPDPRAGQDRPSDDRRQGHERGLLSRQNPRNAPQQRGSARGGDRDADRRPARPASSSRERGRPDYEPYADAPWNQSWQWSNDPHAANGADYSARPAHWADDEPLRAGQWEPDDPWEPNQPNQEWSADNTWNQGDSRDARNVGAQRGGGAGSGGPKPKKTWQQRLGLTREQWQWTVLRSWPGVLRLVMVMIFAGALIGLLTFSTRPIPIGGTPSVTSQLTGIGNFKASPTIPLFNGTEPIYAAPTNTPVPTTVKATSMIAAPATVTTNCATGFTSSATTLKNTTSGPIQYTIAPGGDLSISPSSQAQGTGTLPPNQTATLTFDATPLDCTASNAKSVPSLINWSTTDGKSSGSITITDNITPAIVTIPTATPTNTGPTSTPTSPAPTDTPTSGPGGGNGH